MQPKRLNMTVVCWCFGARSWLLHRCITIRVSRALVCKCRPSTSHSCSCVRDLRSCHTRLRPARRWWSTVWYPCYPCCLSTMGIDWTMIWKSSLLVASWKAHSEDDVVRGRKMLLDMLDPRYRFQYKTWWRITFCLRITRFIFGWFEVYELPIANNWPIKQNAFLCLWGFFRRRMRRTDDAVCGKWALQLQTAGRMWRRTGDNHTSIDEY